MYLRSFPKRRYFSKIVRWTQELFENIIRLLRQATSSSALRNFECSLGVVLSMGLGVAIVRLSRFQVASIKVFLMNKIRILSHTGHISSSFKPILDF